MKMSVMNHISISDEQRKLNLNHTSSGSELVCGGLLTVVIQWFVVHKRGHHYLNPSNQRHISPLTDYRYAPCCLCAQLLSHGLMIIDFIPVLHAYCHFPIWLVVPLIFHKSPEKQSHAAIKLLLLKT